MTAIAGLYGLDGDPAAPDAMARCARALAHRGRPSTWLRARVALTGIGSEPCVDAATGVVVVADAATGAAAILAAYREWGPACVTHLTGDFAFAIYDPRRRLVFCARDPMGVKPFYYYHAPRRFAFATEVNGLLAFPFVPGTVDAEQIARYLSTTAVDRVSTFYQHIRRLPAAHTLSVTPDGISLSEYWRADAAGTLRLGSDAEYAAAFGEHFRAAVRLRLPDAGPVGASLSGGLDSSSIVCTARQLGAAPLHTFSLIFPNLSERARRAIDERPYMDEVIALGGIEPHFVPGDLLSPLSGLDATLAQTGQPFGAPNLYLHQGMFAAAQRAGVRVFFDGFDGDATVSHGIGRLNDLARRGDWSGFEAEVRAFAAHRDITPQSVLPHFGLPFLADLARRGRLLRWALGARQLAKRFGLSRREVVQHALSSALRFKPADDSVVRPELRRRVAEKLHADVPATAGEHSAHVQGLTQPLYQHTLELADAAAAAYGVEPRYPFFDRKLIEFCVSVPAEQKFAGGWTRLIMRRAMAGVLPQSIQWRGTKSNLSYNFDARLGADREQLQNISWDALAPYVDVTRARAVRDRTIAGSTAQQQLAIRLTILARWLARADVARRAA